MPNGHHYADHTRDDDQVSVLTRGQNSGEEDTELVSTRIPYMDPSIVTNQSGSTRPAGIQPGDRIVAFQGQQFAPEGASAEGAPLTLDHPDLPPGHRLRPHVFYRGATRLTH